MRKKILPALSGLLVLGCIITGQLSAATFTVSPSSLTVESSDSITLAANGFTLHQSFLIEEFFDANTNGAVDSGELLLLSLQVTDGEIPLFGGVRDTQRPGDEDGLTNGQISVEFALAQLPERVRVSGHYVFRLTPQGVPGDALSQGFEVAMTNYGQAVKGVVRSGNTVVASATVILLSQDGEEMEFAGGAVANASGEFLIPAAPGDYAVIPFKLGYVADMENGAFVSLLAGADSTQDLSLVAADRVVSGRVYDGITSNGIAGLQLFFDSDEGLFTLATTDASGNFSVAVTAGQWGIEVSDTSAALLGYGRGKIAIDATAGDVTGISLPLTRSRGSFELVFFFRSGSFGDGTNGVLPFPTDLNYYYGLYNVQDGGVTTNVFFGGPTGSGLSNTASAVFGANYDGDSAFYSSPQINIPAYPPGGIYVVNYKNEAQQFLLTDPQAEVHQVILQPFVVVNSENHLQSISWTYRDVTGSAIATPPFISNIEIRVDGAGGRLYDADISPDQTAHLVTGQVVWTNVSSIQMVYDDVLGNQYVGFWNRGEQALEIVSQPLPGARVGSFYDQLFVAAGGRTPYSWSFVSGTLPGGLTFTPVTGELHGTPVSSGTFTFTVRVTDSVNHSVEKSFELVVAPRLSPMQTMPVSSPGQFNLRFAGQPGSSYSLEYSTNLSNWATLLTTNLASDSVEFHDLTATNRHRFYRIVLNP